MFIYIYAPAGPYVLSVDLSYFSDVEESHPPAPPCLWLVTESRASHCILPLANADKVPSTQVHILAHVCVARTHKLHANSHARTHTNTRARAQKHTHTQAIPKTEQWPIALEHLMQASLSNRQPPPQLPQDCHHEFAEFRRFVFETAHRYNKMQMARSHPVEMLDACCAASLALLASVRVYTCIFSYAYTYI